MDNVMVEDGCSIQNSVVCADAHLKVRCCARAPRTPDACMHSVAA